MGESRKFMIATALIGVGASAIVLIRPLLQSEAAAAPGSATPGAPASATSPAPALPAGNPVEMSEANASPMSGRDPETGASAEPPNAQDASPDYAYRAATQPAPAEVPPDAGSEWRRAFEKEERDEAWARPLETEIQKSLEPEISLGRFHVANVECRATLCEVRLLARGSLQRAELDQFQSTIYQLPWAARLDPALSSGTGSGESYEAIWIFERKPGSRAN